MATQYGITSAGFVAKPLSTIEDELDAGLKKILGDSAGTEPDGSIPAASYAGQLKALMADGYAGFWDLIEAAVASFDPNQATDASQDAGCAITGTLREAARNSVATGTCFGAPLTALNTGRVVAASDSSARFVSQTGATLAAMTAWVASAGYTIGDLRTNFARAYLCTVNGIAAGATGPASTAADITDGTAHWKYMAEGSGMAHMPFVAESVGPIGVGTGILSSIATPVNGWNAVYNLRAGIAGALRETNSALRARRDAELAAPGNTTVDAIRANILRVNEGSTDPAHVPPTTCIVFFNDTDSADANGLPAHSIEVLVQDGTDADIAQAIWDSVGAGTATYGTTTSTVIDSEGNSQTVRWTRPTEVPIYVTATAYYDAAAWPPNSSALVAQYALSALLTYTADYPIARDARATPLSAAMLRGPAQVDANGLQVSPADPSANPVPGLLEIDPILIATAPGPIVSTTIPISRRQIATFSSANITITATTETP